MREPLASKQSVPARTTIGHETAAADANGDDETKDREADDRGADRGEAAAAQPLSESLDRWLRVLAVAAMIATFLILPPSYAMTLVALIWLVGTRMSASRRLLGLTLTEALAWVATVAIVAFLSLVLIFVLGSAGG